MDLADISYRQALADIHLANQRILFLVTDLERASNKLAELRSKIASETAVSLGANQVSSPMDASVPSDYFTTDTSFEGAEELMSSITEDIKADAGLRSKLRRWILPVKITWHIDEFEGVRASRKKYSIRSSAVSSVTFRGWMVPSDKMAAFAWVEIGLQGAARSVSRRIRPTERFDVAEHFDNDRLARCGFKVAFPTEDLGIGTYILFLKGWLDSGAEGRVDVAEVEIK